MIFLKRGAQYSVYPALGGRVCKIPNTPSQTVRMWRSWAEGKESTPEELHQKVTRAIEDRERTVARIQYLCANYPVIYDYLAQPKFGRKGIYTQLRVKT